MIGSSRATGNQLIDNIAHCSNGDGIELYYARDTIVLGNDVRANKGGIALNNSQRATGSRTTTPASPRAPGSSSELSFSQHHPAQHLQPQRRRRHRTSATRPAPARGSWIEGNGTSNNKGYGIFVPRSATSSRPTSPTTTATWGIWASEGSNGRVNVDGGGNKAQGNLGPLDPLTLQAAAVLHDPL